MSEAEERMLYEMQKQVDTAKSNESAMIETIVALQKENEALWNLIRAMKDRWAVQEKGN